MPDMTPGGETPLEALPEQIADLSLGECRSDGETMCTGCWDRSDHDINGNHDIPAGEPIYWTSAHPEYGDCDPYCRGCAEDRDKRFDAYVDSITADGGLR